MARWVFRPFAQFRRAICTSAPNQEHPPVFPLASLLSSKDRHLSGISIHALHAVSFKRNRLMVTKKTCLFLPTDKNHFHYALWDWSFPIELACMLNSLVRVSRRDELVHHWIQHFSFPLLPGTPERLQYHFLRPKNPNYNRSESNRNVIPMNRKRTRTTHISSIVQQKRNFCLVSTSQPLNSKLVRQEKNSLFKEKETSYQQSNRRKNY